MLLLLPKSYLMLLSIILPIYNGESTLGEAIDSVLAQSAPHWELIIVDDCSSDGSLQLANEYSKKDSRIRVFSNSENMGPSVARNKGIAIAKGDYIGFLDCDDTLHQDFVKRMTETAILYNADVVWCQYISLADKNDIGLSIRNEVPANIIFNAGQAIELFFKDTFGVGCLWNKIYSRPLFSPPNGVKLNPERVRAEDWEFNLFVFKTLNKLVVLDDFLYNYYHRNTNSIMSRFRKKDYDLMWRSIYLLEDVNKEMNLGKSYKNIINIKGDTFIEFIYKGVKTMTYKELIEIFKQERFRTYIDNLEIERLPLTYKVLAKLLKSELYRTAVGFVKIKSRFLD